MYAYTYTSYVLIQGTYFVLPVSILQIKFCGQENYNTSRSRENLSSWNVCRPKDHHLLLFMLRLSFQILLQSQLYKYNQKVCYGSFQQLHHQPSFSSKKWWVKERFKRKEAAKHRFQADQSSNHWSLLVFTLQKFCSTFISSRLPII